MTDTDHTVDSETTIRVTETTSPVTGRPLHYARIRINGYCMGTTGQREGDTLESALNACLEGIWEKRRLDARLADLSDAGYVADLTGSHAPGIHLQMEEATGSPARSTNDHYRE